MARIIAVEPEAALRAKARAAASAAAAHAAGFDVKTLERIVFPDRGLRRRTAPHLIGVAVRPV